LSTVLFDLIVPKDLKFESLKFQELDDAAFTLLALPANRHTAPTAAYAHPNNNFLIAFMNFNKPPDFSAFAINYLGELLNISKHL
jgi:hypothetical protein